jgi:hypothetical protein
MIMMSISVLFIPNGLRLFFVCEATENYGGVQQIIGLTYNPAS